MARLDILCFNPFNLKNIIMEIERKKIFRGPSKTLKNISWPINISLKYFIGPTKNLRPVSGYESGYLVKLLITTVLTNNQLSPSFFASTYTVPYHAISPPSLSLSLSPLSVTGNPVIVKVTVVNYKSVSLCFSNIFLQQKFT